jgi:hypothetical protein
MSRHGPKKKSTRKCLIVDEEEEKMRARSFWREDIQTVAEAPPQRLIIMADDNDATDVFVYMGEGVVVPRDVVRVRIDPSVLVIPEHAFFQRCKLETIELHDGLCKIDPQAFMNCRALREVQSSEA